MSTSFYVWDIGKELGLWVSLVDKISCNVLSGRVIWP